MSPSAQLVPLNLGLLILQTVISSIQEKYTGSFIVVINGSLENKSSSFVALSYITNTSFCYR